MRPREVWQVKKGKPPEEWSSYQLISALNADYKLLAKVLATRLETLLPSITNSDQTGFIRGRFSSHNVRRLLNLIHFSLVYSSKALVESLDAKKAFDRLECPYLFLTLQYWQMDQTRLSPEPAIICSSDGAPCDWYKRRCNYIKGVLLKGHQHKISLYADDFMLYLEPPKQSIPKQIRLISEYSLFSRYKIYFSKSEVMPLNSAYRTDPNILQLFHWSTTLFSYLGLKISPRLSELYS